MTVTVLVADDQAVVRDGVVLLLSSAPDIRVVATAANGAQAVAAALAHRPQVALVDLRMPELSGAEVTAELARLAPDVRVLILTTYADDDAVLPALRAGAAGYLTKDVTSEDLLAAVRAVAAGGTVLGPAVQARLVQLLRHPDDVATRPTTTETPSDRSSLTSGEADELPEGLTRREIDVVRLVAQGLTNQQVARSLVLSEATVKTHLNHVLSKLGVDGRGGLVAWAWRNGLGQG